MSDTETIIYNNIIEIIAENLKLLIIYNDLCLREVKKYCSEINNFKYPIEQKKLTKFTEDALYALLNADFLYDYREIE